MRYPLSFAQRRLRLLTRPMPGEAVLPYAIWLNGPIDPAALQRAMDTMVARHAALRTSIGTGPEQVVAETASVPIYRVVLPGGPAGSARAESIAAELAGRAFDLAHGPLLRAALIEAGPQRSLFVLVLHRIIADETALAVLLAELSRVYSAGALPPLWMDYGDYAVWQRDRLRGEELARQLGFWRDRLRNLSRTPTAARVSVAIEHRDETAALAAFAVVLARYFRRTDVVIGIPVTGRIRPELDPIVGPFADTVPLRVSLAGDPTFAELCDRVRDAAAQARAHDELPFQKLIEELGPLPDVRFTGSCPVPVLDLPGVTAQERILFPTTATHNEFGRAVAAVLNHAPDTRVLDFPVPDLEAPPAELDVLTALRESTATITDAGETVPMSTLSERAARLARALAERGIGPETRVGLCLERGAGMLTAVLGVWWAGGAVVQLEPGLPLARLEIMARDAGLGLVVSDAEHAGLAASVGEVVTLDQPALPLDPVPVPGEALAYTVFVSGPTGPDGVDIEHRSVANRLAALRRDLGLGAGDRFVAAPAASPDLALLELLLAPVCGADLVIATEDAETPPHTWHPEIAAWAGEPADHTRVYVLDERLAPVPAGTVGEIHMAGAALARGYLGRPGRTAAAFRPDPWGIEPGARMYATGDLGRWREDGGLELVDSGRVTIRGVRVHRGEVEAVLRAHRAVRDAAVLGGSRAGEPVLVAYVVPDPDGPAARSGADLATLFRPQLRAALPEPMIPALFVALPMFPLRADGTVNRAALPEPEWAAAFEDRVAPCGPVQVAMARIWAELLRTAAPIGVHDNLFRMGGGSLTAIRFAARIADTYGVNLPMHRILATPTIAELAEIVAAEQDPACEVIR
ncbi:MAG: condensation domain-containing protein [Labedaea sp.]